MSDVRGSRFDDRGADSRFDRAVDGAVREMLEVEPRPGLRGRVLDRLVVSDGSTSGFWRISWFAVPVAAAAVLIVAVLMQSRTVAPVPARVPQRAQQVAPTGAAAQVARANPPVSVPGEPEQGLGAGTTASPRRTATVSRDRVVLAASYDPGDDRDVNAVAPLAAPESLVIPRLVMPAAVPLPSTVPEPMQVRALEITALPESPRERREE